MCKCRFWSGSLGKAERFLQSPLSICVVGCDEQSLVRKTPTCSELALVCGSFPSLASVVCSASLQCWFGEVAQLENEGADERGGRGRVGVEVQQKSWDQMCSSFSITVWQF